MSTLNNTWFYFKDAAINLKVMQAINTNYSQVFYLISIVSYDTSEFYHANRVY